MKSKAMLMVGIAAVLVASLFALPALASSRDGNGDRIRIAGRPSTTSR